MIEFLQHVQSLTTLEQIIAGALIHVVCEMALILWMIFKPPVNYRRLADSKRYFFHLTAADIPVFGARLAVVVSVMLYHVGEIHPETRGSMTAKLPALRTMLNISTGNSLCSAAGMVLSGASFSSDKTENMRIKLFHCIDAMLHALFVYESAGHVLVLHYHVISAFGVLTKIHQLLCLLNVAGASWWKIFNGLLLHSLHLRSVLECVTVYHVTRAVWLGFHSEAMSSYPISFLTSVLTLLPLTFYFTPRMLFRTTDHFMSRLLTPKDDRKSA